MVKKRSVFDINFEADDEPETEGFPAGNPPLETKSFNVQGHPMQNEAAPTRRGPMASAITEAADATSERATAEAAIRAENDALAHEHVRLKKMGLITDLIDTSSVVITKLTRDRSASVDPELEELKDSIRAVGLSNPIRVEQTDSGYELIQGFRRLAAFKELATETGDARYGKIPAALVPRGEPLVDLYRKMVDENLVRKDISFGEMAQLALSYAHDEGITSGEAVSVLYASALKQKRSYIRQFARVLDALGEALRYPEAIPRSLGTELYKVIEAEEGRGAALVDELMTLPIHDAPSEMRILRNALSSSKERQPSKAKSVSKTSLRLTRPEGEAKVIAQNGRVELRLSRDFSAINREKLQAAVEAFLSSLD
jgi:ParB family chromosome partitioning protein